MDNAHGMVGLNLPTDSFPIAVLEHTGEVLQVHFGVDPHRATETGGMGKFVGRI